MIWYEVQKPRFEPILMPFSLFLFTHVGMVLELLADTAGMRNKVPAPIDIFAHGGNISHGGTVAMIAVLLRLLWGAQKRYPHYLNRYAHVINAEQLRQFRRTWVPTAMAVTVLINLTVETRWGVDNLPFATWLGGTTPDAWDLVHSVAWTGICATFVWRRVRKRIWALA